MSDHTKWRLADSLIEIMRHKPFDKITVKEVCDQCDEQRQTFYYHFQDKYDLVTWIYYQDATQIIETYKAEPWDVVLEKIFDKMRQRKAFYKNAFEVTSQNALIDYLVRHDTMIYEKKLKEKLQTDELNERLSFAIQYHSYACVHITKNWISQESSMSPKELAQMMFRHMPNELREASSPI